MSDPTKPSSDISLPADFHFGEIDSIPTDRQVVAIRNLNGGGSALSSSIGTEAGPITGDHFHLRMQTEPTRKTIGGSFRKQVDHL
jgi:hypothetical protein